MLKDPQETTAMKATAVAIVLAVFAAAVVFGAPKGNEHSVLEYIEQT